MPREKHSSNTAGKTATATNETRKPEDWMPPTDCSHRVGEEECRQIRKATHQWVEGKCRRRAEAVDFSTPKGLAAEFPSHFFSTI